MPEPNENYTERELREAYKQSGLWRSGWSFQRATTTDAVLRGMKIFVKDMRKRFEQQHGKPAPMQRAIFEVIE